MPQSPASAAAHASAANDRSSLYEEITSKIIAELEAGRLPWVQPWGSAGVSAPLGIPRNAATGRNYSGILLLILWGAVVQHGYAVQCWLTFRQALGLGGNVRKGERGTTVVYADRFGSAKYAMDEVVELSTSFVCAALGIVPTVRHADYIASWAEILQKDNRAIVRAASAASKAADYLLSFLPDAAATKARQQEHHQPSAPPAGPRGSRGRGPKRRS